MTTQTREGVDGTAWPPALRRRLGIIGNPSAAAVSAASSSSKAKAKVVLVRSSDNIDVNSSPDIEECELKLATGDNINSDSDSDFDSYEMPTSLASSSAITAKSSTSTSTRWTTNQLQQSIHSSYDALTSIQRQLYRGEEFYFEESSAHRGNLFQGWDNVWIEHGNNSNTGSSGSSNNNNINGHSNINSNSNSGVSASGSSESNKIITGAASSSSTSNQGKSLSSTTTTTTSASMRKMPPDYRWFSSSCGIPLPIFATTGATARGGVVVGGGVWGKYDYVDGTIMDGERAAALERPSLMICEDDDEEDEPAQQTSSIPSSPLDNVPSEERMANEEEGVEAADEDDDAN
jgi:hypothetical protein